MSEEVNNLIVSVDDNSLYTSYWPYISKIWNHFGVNPICIFLTENNATFKYPSQYGKIVSIKPVPGLNIVWQAQIVRFFAAAAIPGYNTIYDIDMFPCNSNYVNVLNFLKDNKGITTRSDLPTILAARRFGAGGISASQSLFNIIFKENNIHVTIEDFWSAKIREQCTYIKKTIHKGCAESVPGRDELFFYQCVINCLEKIPTIVGMKVGDQITNRAVTPSGLQYPMPTIQEIEENKKYWNFNTVSNFWEAHICRDKTKEVTTRLTDIICSTPHKEDIDFITKHSSRLEDIKVALIKKERSDLS